MPLATDVRYYSADMFGAPQVNLNAGTLLEAIHACLVTGFNTQTASSGTVASNVVTLTFAAAHNYLAHQVIEVAGATPAGVNGQHRIVNVTATTLTYEVTGVADGAVSGTVTAVVAPLGWVREFAGTNKAVYKIDTDTYPLSLPYRVRFSDDQAGQCMQCIGYESMFDIDTGVNRFPAASTFANGMFFQRVWTTGAHPNRSWHLIGTGRQFYLQINSYENSDTGSAGGWGFIGEFPSYKASDPGRFIMYAPLTGTSSTSDYSSRSATHMGNSDMFAARPWLGSGAPQTLDLRALFMDSSASGVGTLPYPNGPDFGLLLTPAYLLDSNNLRGYMPGMYCIMNNAQLRIARDRRTPYLDDNVPDFPGRRIGYFTGPYSSSTWAPVAFDLTGPWY